MNGVSEADAGCWIDGHWGHYAARRLISIAEFYGWEPGDYDEEFEFDVAYDAELWLNENIAPEGFSFGWYDGEFFLWSDSAWEDLW